MFCIPIMAQDNPEALTKMRGKALAAGVFEIRLGTMEPFDLKERNSTKAIVSKHMKPYPHLFGNWRKSLKKQLKQRAISLKLLLVPSHGRIT